LEENIPDWHIATTSKGWTSNDIVLRWLKEIFLPETTHTLCNGQISRRMLILVVMPALDLGRNANTTVWIFYIFQHNLAMFYNPWILELSHY
jgi:hypothetical protein